MLLLPSVSDDTTVIAYSCLWVRCQCRVKQRADMSALSHTTIHTELDARDKTAIIRCEERDGTCDIVARARACQISLEVWRSSRSSLISQHLADPAKHVLNREYL